MSSFTCSIVVIDRKQTRNLSTSNKIGYILFDFVVVASYMYLTSIWQTMVLIMCTVQISA